MVDEKKVSDGYKLTEVGVIPEDWSIRRIGNEIDSLNSGVSVNSHEGDVSLNNPGILKTSSVSKGKFIPSESKRIIKRDLSRVKLNPKYDSLIISRMNTPELVGECGYVDRDYPFLFIPDRLWQTNVKQNSTINCKWLSYVLSSNKYRRIIKDIATGTSNSMKNITKDEFLEIYVPYPNKIEQDAIAEALSDADNLIVSLEKLIDKKKKIKQGAMQQLLTGKKRLPGFSRDWEYQKVESFGEIVTGGTPPTGIKIYWNGNIPWVTPTDITSKKNIDATERMITDFGLSKLRKLPKNSVLITCIASIGKNAIIKNDGACNQQINAIIPNNNYDSVFLYYLFEISKSYLMSNAGITATNIISKKDFALLEFLVPKLNEQKAIAQVLSDMDAEIEALEEKLEKVKTIKQGMMQELLTGRIRLI